MRLSTSLGFLVLAGSLLLAGCGAPAPQPTARPTRAHPQVDVYTLTPSPTATPAPTDAVTPTPTATATLTYLEALPTLDDEEYLLIIIDGLFGDINQRLDSTDLQFK